MTIAAAATIPMFDYVEQYAEIRGEILDAVEGVLASGSLILGPRVRTFEENFCRFLGWHRGRGQLNGPFAGP